MRDKRDMLLEILFCSCVTISLLLSGGSVMMLLTGGFNESFRFGSKEMNEGIAIVVGAVIGLLASLITGNGKLNFIKDKSKDIITRTDELKSELIGKVIPELNAADKERSKIADEISFIAEDIKAKNILSEATGGAVTRNQLIADIDKVYKQNSELSEQLAAATAKIEDLKHELETARAEIKILHSAEYEDEHTV